MSTLSKNIPIELLRFLLMSLLCLAHHDYTFERTSLHHGYLVVEFFFMISGFFIYRSYTRHSEIGVLDFTFHRIKKFVVPVTICLLLFMLIDRKQYLYPPKIITPDTLLDTYFSHIHEFFFLQGVGLTDRMPIIFPLWFVSVLIVGGGIIWSMLKLFGQKAISFYIPILIVFGINYNSLNNSFLVANIINHIPGIQASLLRGLLEIGTGVLVAYVYETRNAFFYKYRRAVLILGFISLTGYGLMLFAKSNFDYLILIFIPLIIFLCLNLQALFRKIPGTNFFLWLGSLSMYMFFIHSFIGTIVTIVNVRLDSLHYHFGLLSYYVVVIVASIILKYVSDKISASIPALR